MQYRGEDSNKRKSELLRKDSSMSNLSSSHLQKERTDRVSLSKLNSEFLKKTYGGIKKDKKNNYLDIQVNK